MLGYSQISWDYSSRRGSVPASADKYWFELTEREKAAANILGYDQRMWDGLDAGPQPPAEDKAWSELSYGERTAAMTLGYNQVTWDNESGSESMPAADDTSWNYLTEDQQYAALDLGYDRKSWDGPRPNSVYKFWSELSSCGELKSCIGRV